MREKVIGIIGNGSAGMTVAAQLTRKSLGEIVMFGTGQSIPETYPDVIPNSPSDEYLAPLIEAQDDLADYHHAWSERLLDEAEHHPSLRQVSEMERILFRTVYDREEFRYVQAAAEEIRPGTERRYTIDAETGSFETDAVICCQGAKPGPLPQYYEAIFDTENEISLRTAFDPRPDYNGINVAVIGAAHSAAIAARNAMVNGADTVAIVHRRDGDPIRPYREVEKEGVTVKYNRFTGVREPHYERLQRAQNEHDHTYLHQAELDPAIHGDWHYIDATGFEPNPLHYDDKRLINTQQGTIGETAPRVRNPHTGEPFEHIYGTGIAFPKTYRNGCLDTGGERTVDRDGASVAGINLTLTDAQRISERLEEVL